MIGPPGVGKSTQVEGVADRYVVVSSDRFIDRWAERSGLTYDEYMLLDTDDKLKRADKCFRRYLALAIKAGRWIVIDRTNLRAAARTKLVKRFHDNGYHVTYLLMRNVTWEKWALRLKNRKGKTLNAHVIGSMILGYEEPTSDEGYDSIAFV